MSCPNCGTTEPGPGAFCMRCGAKQAPEPTPTQASTAYQPPLAQPAAVAPAVVAPVAVAPALVSAPIRAAAPPPRDAVTTIHHISVGSVFKVTFVIYALLLGVFGCFFVMLPGLLGSSLLGGMLGDRYGLGAMGGGIVGTLIVYVLLVFVGAFVYGLVMAVAVLIYNLVAGWVGGVRVELRG
jgi:hypothetical protein